MFIIAVNIISREAKWSLGTIYWITFFVHKVSNNVTFFELTNTPIYCFYFGLCTNTKHDIVFSCVVLLFMENLAEQSLEFYFPILV